jgi:beta-phosphoglucomutase-like phosphatase (HAD superfamily)
MTTQKRINAVIWDLDGVLIDSEPGYNIAEKEMMRSLGYEFGEREIAKTTGASYKDIDKILALDGPHEKIESMYVDALMRSVSTDVSGLIDGVTDFFGWMKAAGMKMAIGSSSPRRIVEFVAGKFGLWTWMDIIVTGTDVENGKPSPEIFLKCASLLGVDPAECLVIEDSTNGVLAGKSAGMSVCAFTGTSYHHLDLSGADLEIESYSPQSREKIERWLDGGATV